MFLRHSGQEFTLIISLNKWDLKITCHECGLTQPVLNELKKKLHLT